MSLVSAIHDIITTTAGDAVDIVRIMSLLGFATYLGLAIYAVVWQKQPFSYHEFGIGLGAVIAATGIGIKMNSDNDVSANTLTQITTTR